MVNRRDINEGDSYAQLNRNGHIPGQLYQCGGK